MIHQLYEWYLQIWPNVVAAPIIAALSWLIHRFTFYKHSERRHKELIAAMKDK